MRNAAVNDARLQTQRLAENIAAEQQNLITSAQQLIIALTQLRCPVPQQGAHVAGSDINIQRLNPQYSNILIADPDGQVWAMPFPADTPSMYPTGDTFKTQCERPAVSGGIHPQPVYNASHFQHRACVSQRRGAIDGVIIVGFVLEYYKQALVRSGLPPESAS
jgi:hypothetical protein